MSLSLRKTYWWGAGLTLALLVKVAGLTVGGWLSALGLFLMSLWVPSLAEVSGQARWSWRQRWQTWALVVLTGVLWLPLGWGGYLATLQASIQLPASLQNGIFNSRYEWLPVVGPFWGIVWLWSFKWLPSLRRQLQRPTSYREYWLTGWHASWWAATKQVLRVLPWVVVWLGIGALQAGGVWLSELIQPSWGYLMAVLSFALLQLLAWWGVWQLWHRYWPRRSVTGTNRWVKLILVIAAVGYASWWLQPVSGPLPAVIAHRGVNGPDGVQNTTSALRQTVKQTQPNMVEMDIQPTDGRHWVVMHDPDLRHLADRPGPVQRYKLKQLDGITLSENGQRGQLSTFKQYLTVAEKLHQPLLVEVKALGDAAQLMGPFAADYGQRLIQAHGAVHSLDYQVIERLRQRQSQLRLGLITPFYLTNFSHSVADFYSLQALTATREQVNAMHRDGHAVYFWTVDQPLAMQRLSAMGADGLITNRPGKLRQLQAKPTHYYFYQLINWLVSWL